MLSIAGQINFLAVLAAVVAGFIMAGAWFGAVVVKPYNLALGRGQLPPQKPGALYIVGPQVCNLIAVLTSAVLIKLLSISTMPGAVSFGLVVGLGYLASTCMNVAINPNFPRPFLYTLINAPYFILNSIVTSAILVAMG